MSASTAKTEPTKGPRLSKHGKRLGRPQVLTKQEQLAQVARAKRAWVARHNDLHFRWPSEHLIARREMFRHNLRLFCDRVFPKKFSLPHSEDQLATLKEIQEVALNGGRRAIARPRGSGKTEQTLAATIWATLFRHSTYTVTFAANSKMARKNLQTIMRAFVFNATLRKLWPELCIPISEAFQKPNRAKYLTWEGKPMFLECGATRLVLPYYKQSSESIAVIECAGILEAARGLRYDGPAGETLRPKLLIGDDFQTKTSARSESQCRLRIETITGDFGQMGGPDTATGIILNCTTIEPGDAADQLLDRKKHPEFGGMRQSFVKSWPVASRHGMEQRKIPYDGERDLWGKYMAARKSGMADGDDGRAAAKFYIENRPAMDEGSLVGWEHRFIRQRGEVSAIQHAFNVIADDGEKSFSCEYQNVPIQIQTSEIRLNADNILQRINNLSTGEVPEESQVVTGFIDVNDHALAWAMGAWHLKANAVTGSIIGYGEWARNGNGRIGNTHRPDKIWDEAKPAPEGKEVAFWNAMNGLAEWLFTPGRWTRKGQDVSPNLVLIDSGYTLTKGDTTLYRWISTFVRGGGDRVGYSRGWPARTFRIEKTSEGANSEVLKASRENWWRFERYKPLENVFGLPHDAEHHDMQTQKAWLLPAGAPGSLTLNGTAPEEHAIFAQQIAGLKLIEFKPTEAAGTSGHYVWHRTPGVRNEMSDCVRGCRLAAVYRLGDSEGAVMPVLTIIPSAPTQPGPSQVRPAQRRQREPDVVQMPGWQPRY